MSTPAASTSLAKSTSYAVTTTSFFPSRFILTTSRMVTRLGADSLIRGLREARRARAARNHGWEARGAVSRALRRSTPFLPALRCRGRECAGPTSRHAPDQRRARFDAAPREACEAEV